MSLTDPMQFEIVRDALEALLNANQASFFRTIGEQKQTTDAKEVEGTKRSVSVYFSEGDFSGNSSHIELDHDITFSLDYSVSSPSKADIATLADSNASASEIQAALLEMDEGTRLADRLLDEFHRIVVQIIMDPVNYDLGLADHTVSNRKITTFRKVAPEKFGSLVLLKGTATMTATVTEKLIGATGTEPVGSLFDITSKPITIDSEVDDADIPKIGVKVTPTP